MTVLAASLAVVSPAGAQGSRCAGHHATNGTTRTFDRATNTTTITGTNRADVIVGTGGRDIIRGMDGADIICGVGGNDTIFGGDGNDILYGNEAHDELHGGNGHDIIRGNDGNDVLTGGHGDDNINGGERNDVINGGPGIDTISGGEGSDECRHQQTTDTTLLCESNGGTVTRTPVTVVPAGVTCSQASLSRYYSSRIGAESQTLDDIETRLLALINQTRAICGLDPVAFDRAADRQAQAHSVDMLRAKNSGQSIASWFRHSSRWSTLQGQGARALAGENISFVFPSLDAAHVHRNLIESGSHLCNLLSPNFDWVGFGVTYFDLSSADGQIVTQIFTGDSNIERTSGSLTVYNDLDRPRSGSQNCWN